MSDLARKLGLAPGCSVCLLDAPLDTVEIVRAACPPGVKLVVASSRPEGLAFDPDWPADDTGRFAIILYWPRTLDGLAERCSLLQRCITPGGALWVVMPKKAHARARGITFAWEEMQAAALRTDLVDNKIASFSETEYATRFVIRKDRRGLYE